MKSLFDKVSKDISKQITCSYSTSFSKGISLLGKSIQPKIYAIYGFVRLADEIVDSFQQYDQQQLIDDLARDYQEAVHERISINPILNAFQEVVNQYHLQDLVEPFLASMRMDLDQRNYTDTTMYNQYIHGSAEVVGLMCLKVFVENNESQYLQLKPYAIKLGSAFQKVNFLRDIQDDMHRLGRIYFPNVNWNEFSDVEKLAIVEEVKSEFEEALVGIKKLPQNCKLGVFVAYNYYKSLLKKLSKKKATDIMKNRTRILDINKLFILHQSQLKLKLGLV